MQTDVAKQPDEQKPELLRIREFGLQSRLSQKALRIYDEAGLLKPHNVDGQSGYRYYHPNQIKTAKRIAVLRQLDMPLQQIAYLLALDDATATQHLKVFWNEQKEMYQQKQNTYEFLKTLFEEKGESMFEVKTRGVGQQKIIVISKNAFQHELPDFIPESLGKLHTYLSSQGLQPSGAPFVNYHGMVSNDAWALVEVCQPFIGTIEPTPDISIRIDPSHQEAYTTLSKSQLPMIRQGFEAVETWIKNNNKTITGACREVYWGDWNNTPDTEPVFDVAFLI